MVAVGHTPEPSCIGHQHRLVCWPLAVFLLAHSVSCLRTSMAGVKEWHLIASVGKEVYVVREPVLVTLQWKNTSRSSQRLRVRRPSTITVLRNASKPLGYDLFRTALEQIGGLMGNTVVVASGETFEQSSWLLLGRSRGQREWEFLLSVPGKYSVSFLGLAQTGKEVKVEFEVAPVATEQDRQALRAFSPAAASVFLGETRIRPVQKDTAGLEHVSLKHSHSTYAPYAAIGVAEYLWRSAGGFKLDLERYRRNLDVVIESRRHHPLRPRALYLLARAYMYRKGKKDEVARVAARLAKEHPESPYIGLIEKESGLALGRGTKKKRAVGSRTRRGETKLARVRPERIPEGPREAFEGYWRSFAAGKVDAVARLLHSEFIGDEGGKAAREKRLAWALEKYDVTTLKIEVTDSELRTSHRRPRTLRAIERSWSGRICVITYYITTAMTERRSGKNEGGRSGPLQTALLKTDGKWLLISEHAEPQPRNWKAGMLANQLEYQLSKSFETVKVWDGREDVVLRDELKSRLLKEKADAELSWRTVRMTMAGPKRDMPRFEGEVTLQRSDKGNGSRTSRSRVVVSFVLDDGRLRLAAIEPVQDQ
ncbi:MAG: nuclear transport factor 2 family protein [Candidatus Brocadiae bacterium]|nr:nuclear transport factor 2 family protein [Candidatus Brocadiia bacterium]